MNQQNWKRKEYASFDEAFRGLSPIIRQQSVRVAGYTRALFVSACALRFGANVKGGEDRIRGAYADLAYKCGMYHQLGKALVPHEYQIWQNDFTEEEGKVYKKYTTDGRTLVASLQEKGTRAKEKRKGRLFETATQNIPWLMLREACEQHMERFDGSGYPRGLKGDAISPIAQIVGLAKELDRLASETRSEDPFNDALKALSEGAEKEWSRELLRVLEVAKDDCREVYNKYIAYTRALPKTIPLVDKKADRVMGLSYRPMISDSIGTVLMYEAEPWFGGIANQPDERESAEELRELFKRTSLTEDISWYLLYEASDAVVRMNNCRLEVKGIVLNMLPDFYNLKTQLQKFNQLFVDQPIERDQLWLTIPAETVKNGTKTQTEILGRYVRNGVRFVVDGYRPAELPPERLEELGLKTVRLDPSLYLNHETAELMTSLREKGFTFVGGGADTPETLTWLIATGTLCSVGTVTGNPVNEDELILDSLARESS